MSETGIVVQEQSPWLTVDEARARAKCGRRPIYRAVKSGHLQAVCVNGRGELRFRAEWVDEWMMSNLIGH